VCAGYFQSEKGQSGCIGCHSLGGFYQELPAQTACVACPASTQRYIGVLTAATKSSCQCKQGDVSVELALLDGLRLLAVQATSTERAGPERCDPSTLWLPQRAVCICASSASSASVLTPCVHPLDVGRSIVDVSVLQACEKCTTRRISLP
jgi:hypothetical protein